MCHRSLIHRMKSFYMCLVNLGKLPHTLQDIVCPSQEVHTVLEASEGCEVALKSAHILATQSVSYMKATSKHRLNLMTSDTSVHYSAVSIVSRSSSSAWFSPVC